MNPNAASIPQLFTLIVIVINSCTHSSDPHCGINIYVYCKLLFCICCWNVIFSSVKYMSSKTKDNLILIVQGCKQVTVGLRSFILKSTERNNPSAAKAAAEVYFEGGTLLSGMLGERNESESSLITSFRFIRILLACHQLLLLQLLL